MAVHGLLNPDKYNPQNKNDAYISGNLGRAVPKLTQDGYVAPPKITAVGVYDTVSSLGLPHIDSSGDAMFDFSICDITSTSTSQTAPTRSPLTRRAISSV